MFPRNTLTSIESKTTPTIQLKRLKCFVDVEDCLYFYDKEKKQRVLNEELLENLAGFSKEWDFVLFLGMDADKKAAHFKKRFMLNLPNKTNYAKLDELRDILKSKFGKRPKLAMPVDASFYKNSEAQIADEKTHAKTLSPEYWLHYNGFYVDKLENNILKNVFNKFGVKKSFPIRKELNAMLANLYARMMMDFPYIYNNYKTILAKNSSNMVAPSDNEITIKEMVKRIIDFKLARICKSSGRIFNKEISETDHEPFVTELFSVISEQMNFRKYSLENFQKYKDKLATHKEWMTWHINGEQYPETLSVLFIDKNEQLPVVSLATKVGGRFATPISAININPAKEKMIGFNEKIIAHIIHSLLQTYHSLVLSLNSKNFRHEETATTLAHCLKNEGHATLDELKCIAKGLPHHRESAQKNNIVSVINQLLRDPAIEVKHLLEITQMISLALQLSQDSSLINQKEYARIGSKILLNSSIPNLGLLTDLYTQTQNLTDQQVIGISASLFNIPKEKVITPAITNNHTKTFSSRL